MHQSQQGEHALGIARNESQTSPHRRKLKESANRSIIRLPAAPETEFAAVDDHRRRQV
jgi:hypothetical protein